MAEYDTAALAGLVGRAIARQRIRCGFTQEQIAERLGIGNEAVSRIERGLVMPNIERLLSLAEVFGCEAADLLTRQVPDLRIKRDISKRAWLPSAPRIANWSWSCLKV